MPFPAVRRPRDVVRAVVLVTACLLTLPTTAAPPARAADGAAPADPGFTWAVQPSGPKGPTGRDHFTWTVRPGQVLTDYVGVSNLGSEPLTLRVYATDAFTTADGGFGVLTADQAPVDVGTWIGFNEATYTIEPGRRADIPFRLTVPADASPGDHVGGILASLVTQGTTGANGPGDRLTLDRRVGTRVYLRVEGPVRAGLVVEDVRVEHRDRWAPTGEAVVRYRLRNTGNVRAAAAARVELTGPFGLARRTTPERAVPELLPGAVYEVTERLRDVPRYGRLTAEVDARTVPAPGAAPDAPGVVSTSARASAWAVPWTVVIALIVVAGVVTAGVVTRHRRRRAAANGSGGNGGNNGSNGTHRSGDGDSGGNDGGDHNGPEAARAREDGRDAGARA